MAQQARPKLICQIAFLRAQLMALPRVVITIDSPNSSGTGSSSTRANSSGGWLNWNFVWSASTNLLSHGYTGELRDLADPVEPRYTDIWGRVHETPEAVRRAILESRGGVPDAFTEWSRALDP